MLDVNGHMLIKHIVKSDFFKKIYVQLVRVIAWNLGYREIENKEVGKKGYSTVQT